LRLFSANFWRANRRAGKTTFFGLPRERRCNTSGAAVAASPARKREKVVKVIGETRRFGRGKTGEINKQGKNGGKTNRRAALF